MPSIIVITICVIMVSLQQTNTQIVVFKRGCFVVMTASYHKTVARIIYLCGSWLF